jgi:hypothetical protein
MTNITFNATRLAAVALHQGNEAARYYLNGVCFEPCGIAVATDGHTLTAAMDSAPEFRGYSPAEVTAALNASDNQPSRDAANGIIIPIDKTVLAALKKRGAETFFYDVAAATVRVLDKNGRVTFTKEDVRAIDATFPDWRRIVPDIDMEGAQTGARFGADIVARVAATAKALADRCGVLFAGVGELSPHVVRYTSTEHGDSIFSVAQPYRDEYAGPLRPDWLSGDSNSADQEAAD